MENQVNTKFLIEKWGKILNHEKFGKLNEKMAAKTAIMLENQATWLNEAGTTWNAGSLDPNSAGYTGDGVFHNIAVPMVRRTFPELIAHEIVGVQPMTQPVGVAFALRYKAGQAYTDYTKSPAVAYSAGQAELGYNAIDKTYSGSYTTSAGEALGSNAGTGAVGVDPDHGLGIGDGTQINEVGLTMEKSIVEARTRKLRARWSTELQQDLKAMHGLDVESEMMDILSYEITQEIDRELIDSIRSVATSGNWDFDGDDSLTGRWEVEKYRAMYNRVVRESNRIAVTTRRGAGNFIIASPSVCAGLETLSSFIVSPVQGDINTAQTGVARIGSIDGRMMLYRDTFAPDDQFIVGYKGSNEFDTGVIYLPYIQLMLSRVVFENSMQPAIGLMSRYAIHNHIFGAANFYRLVKCLNIPT